MISTPNQHRILKRISCAVLVLFFWIALIPFASAHASALDQAPTDLILKNDSCDAQNSASENFQIAQSPKASLKNSAPCLMARIRIVSDQKSNETLVELQINIGNRTLAYFCARYYHAQLGRFISRDPWGFVDGMSLYRGYFAPGGVDPYGFWKWELGQKGEIWAVSEGNTLQDLVSEGYPTQGVRGLSSCGCLDQWVPEGCKYDVTEFLDQSVGNATVQQQCLELTPERMLRFLKRKYGWDPTEFTWQERLEEIPPGANATRFRLLVSIYERLLAGEFIGSCGEIGWSDLTPGRLDYDAIGQCYDFNCDAWGLGAIGTSRPNPQEDLLLSGVLVKGNPQLNDTVVVRDVKNTISVGNEEQFALSHVGIVLGNDNSGITHAISRRGGHDSIVVSEVYKETFLYYSGFVEFYRKK